MLSTRNIGLWGLSPRSVSGVVAPMFSSRRRAPRSRATRLVVWSVLVAKPMRGLGLWAFVAGMTGVALALIACGGPRMPQPLPFEKNLTSAYVEADYPPPPGRVEMIPAIPKEGAVWLDGEWVWQGGRWSWKAGRWVMAPEGSVFSPWTGTRNPQGTYYVAEGTWRDKNGKDLPDPVALTTAKVRGGSVVGPSGEDIDPTPNVRTDKRRTGKERDTVDAGPPETPQGATPTGSAPRARDAGALPADAPQDTRDAGSGEP